MSRLARVLRSHPGLSVNTTPSAAPSDIWRCEILLLLVSPDGLSEGQTEVLRTARRRGGMQRRIQVWVGLPGAGGLPGLPAPTGWFPPELWWGFEDDCFDELAQGLVGLCDWRGLPASERGELDEARPQLQPLISQPFELLHESLGVSDSPATPPAIEDLIADLLLKTRRPRRRPEGSRGGDEGGSDQGDGSEAPDGDGDEDQGSAPNAAVGTVGTVGASASGSGEGSGSGHSPPAPPAPAASAGEPAASADPPRSAHARVECPAQVRVESEFTLTVGLAAAPVPGVTAGTMLRPEGSVGAYTLGVQVLAHGFRPLHGCRLQQDLRVTAEDPYPALSVRLQAELDLDLRAERDIQVIYTVDGQVIGVALRHLRVVEHDQPLAPAPVEQHATLGIPTASQAPDLTVTVARSAERAAGSLLWSWQRPTGPPNDGAAGEDAAQISSVGVGLEDYHKDLIRKVATHEGRPSLPAYLRGLGKSVARNMPRAVLDAIQETCHHAAGEGRYARILLLTAEPHVPWELALLPDPADTETVAFLGAQAEVGRWIFGNFEPQAPAVGPLGGSAIAVVVGDYSQTPGWNRLEAAEQEAEDLVQAHAASKVDATEVGLLQVLAGDPPGDVLHFAMHGSYDPGGLRDGLVLADGRMLDPLAIEGFELARRPFVFLNACQASGGQQVLGQYGGLAAAFLYAGASAVLAPLWSVGDAAARDIAIRFYRDCLAGARPAALLREARARLDSNYTSATHLGYQFFGHPAFALVEDPGGP